MSAGAPSSRPKAIAARAWTPPTAKIRSAPDTCAAYSTAGCGPPFSEGGVVLTTWGTPAARATPTVMNALASSGNRPAGR